MKTRTSRSIFLGGLGALALFAAVPSSLRAAEPLKPQGDPPATTFNRLHTYEEIVDYLKGYAAAYPKWTRLESIGKSGQGRDLWMITITNPATGSDLSKPAMYIDGNTHANEVQGAEAALYTVDFLAQELRPAPPGDRDAGPLGLLRPAHGQPRRPDALVQGPLERRLPPHRHGAAGRRPRRQGGRGRLRRRRRRRLHHHHAQEGADGPGHPRLDPKDPRLLVALEPGELGDWLELGEEGFDNDGDGRVNEDTVGYVDPNRTWGFSWEPEYVQAGAGAYPAVDPGDAVDRDLGDRSTPTSPPSRATTTTAR